MSSFSTYQSPLRTGLPSKDDAEWVQQLLGKFMNRQTALFMRWLDLKLPTKKEHRKRLVVITPLRIILIKTKTFGRSVHRKYRIIDIASVNVIESDQHTECILKHCDFPPELSLSRSREKLKNKEYSASAVSIFIPKDVDREFLDILQWSLFIVTRGLPNKFKPTINIPNHFENEISDPVGPGQFVIDRYVAYCDAQSKNSGAGIAASENLIEYTLSSVTSGVFDVNKAFNATKKSIDALQFVCLSQGLSFTTTYRKLVLNQLYGADDTAIAILMTLFETNFDIETLEFRRVDVQTKTMKSLSSSLSCTNGLSKLQELNLIDIPLNKNIVLSLSTGLSYIKLKILRLTNCYLNKTATIQLFNILQKTEQYKHLTHLNISKNQCGKHGTKAISAFLQKAKSLQVLVVADAQLDGNEFFNALTTSNNDAKNNNGLCHLDTLTLLDFSGNNIGERGAAALSTFLKQTRCLNYCKLSRCGLSERSLEAILGAAIVNKNGLNITDRAPTHAEIMLCTDLLCLSLDLSDNNLGTKGADIICGLLRRRNIENYTIVSLNVARNNFCVSDMKNVIYSLRSLACLERLCISENVKRGIGKKTDKDGVIGRALLYLFSQIPTLNELAITGSEQNSCYLEFGLQHFLCATHEISNLEFLDITGNKIGDKQFVTFLQSLSENQRLRLIRCNDNKLSFAVSLRYIELLSAHPSVIDKLPSDHASISSKKSGRTSSSKQYFELKDGAKHNLKTNKNQFEIDRKMISSLPREMRLEKELRRTCGTQYGIALQRIRGTVRNPDYFSRIPQILVKLKNLLSSRGGFSTVGIFRIQPDANEFPAVKRALNTNNFEFRINDINCIANAIKVWYRDLPIRILNGISKSVLINKCSTQSEVAQCCSELVEPYKSVFEWLLDLAVSVVDNVSQNKMDEKNMAVVLCPNLYENDEESNDAMTLQTALLQFTQFAIVNRCEFRSRNPMKEINDKFAIDAGLTPGIADQNALMNSDSDSKSYDEDVSLSISVAEEGDADAFAGGAQYAASSRFRGLSKLNNDDDNGGNVAKMRNKFENKKRIKEEDPPPPAFAARNSGKIKNMAANLGIDPKAMLPGSKAPKINRNKQKQNNNAVMSTSVAAAKPAGPKGRRKSKKKKNKKLLLESMVDNYDEASQPKQKGKNEVKEEEPPRRFSHHVPMESKVLGGFVQPGLMMSMVVQSGADENKNKKKSKKHHHHHHHSSSSDDDEVIPALAHLENDGEQMDGDGGEVVMDYVYEEQRFEFETKPMGFQIEAENGKISVRSVRAMSAAGKYGIKSKWNIVAVNGFRDWSSMLGILESSLGPFTIIFAVPLIKQNNEKSVSKSEKHHPIVPVPIAAPVVIAPLKENKEEEGPPPPFMAPPISPKVIEKHKSIVSIENDADDSMKPEEYRANRDRFDLMQRNSSAIAKSVLNSYDEEDLNAQIQTKKAVFVVSNSVQQKEYLRLEKEISKFQTKTAQLLETLQVIRLKGEMERIELENAKKLQNENKELKNQLNAKIKPLKDQLKNANKQIQTQRQLMYQYANLLRRHKINIPELQVSLHENESSSDSDSDSDSSDSSSD